jgi:hypothetical protein
MDTVAKARSQQGVVMVTVVIAMLVLIGMAGLALDMGHAYLNKARLQNVLDAGALSAAKVLDDTQDDLLAKQAGCDTIQRALDGQGNAELRSGACTDQFRFEFFTRYLDNTDPPPSRFVRVSTSESATLNSWFIGVLGFNTKRVGGSAVAGPSTALVQDCNIAPMMMCAEEGHTAADNWGYETGQVYCLTLDAPGSNTCPGNIAPGNFQLLRLDGEPGNLRENMAGRFGRCISAGDTEEVDTEPGISWGQVRHGLNTRFGIYDEESGLTREEYPPDLVTDDVPKEGEDFYRYEDYVKAPSDEPLYGVAGRRVVSVPIADCDTLGTGQTQAKVEGLGCFFLVQHARPGRDKVVYGEFIEGCLSTGTPGQNAGSGSDPYIIQLYKDPNSRDS